MAQIPRAALDYLTNEINGISADARAKVKKVLAELNWDDVAACRDAVCDALDMVMAEYGQTAAQASADFYDIARTACVGEPMGAVAYDGLSVDARHGAVRAITQDIVDGNYKSFNRRILERVDYEIKCAAANSARHNGVKDRSRPRFARVPSGGETCRFCIMLASRGPVYVSQDSAGATDHFHTNCDCRIVPFWDAVSMGKRSSRYSTATIVEGYDPDELYDKYIEFQNNPEYQKKLAASGGKRGIVMTNTNAYKHIGMFADRFRACKTMDELYAEADAALEWVNGTRFRNEATYRTVFDLLRTRAGERRRELMK